MERITKTMENSAKKTVKILKETGALLEGHFILSSGLHSPNYVQCAKVFEYPKHGEKIGKLLAAKIKKELSKQKSKQSKQEVESNNDDLECTVVIGPALGGVVVAYEVGKFLGSRSMFTEREENIMKLRRGFELTEKDKVIIVEDVVTTGKSTIEVMEVVRNFGAKVIGFASIINRSGKDNPFAHLGLPYVWLVKFDFPTYEPENCVLCKSGTPAVKPGSRKV